MRFNKKAAFTLSEVMVTMSLVGALAALTISTVGSVIQQRARLSEFRAAYSKMETVLQDIVAEKGRVYNCYAKMTEDELKERTGSTSGDLSKIIAADSECTQLTHDFVRAMGVTRFCEEHDPITGGCVPGQNYPTLGNGEGFNSYSFGSAYVFDNSMILIISYQGLGLQLFAVDINGRKSPNRWGQDIFPFSVKLTDASIAGYREASNSDADPTPIAVPKAVSILPAPCTACSQGSGKDTDAMMKESVNYD